jgi:hypothetical protein
MQACTQARGTINKRRKTPAGAMAAKQSDTRAHAREAGIGAGENFTVGAHINVLVRVKLRSVEAVVLRPSPVQRKVGGGLPFPVRVNLLSVATVVSDGRPPFAGSIACSTSAIFCGSSRLP